MYIYGEYTAFLDWRWMKLKFLNAHMGGHRFVCYIHTLEASLR